MSKSEFELLHAIVQGRYLAQIRGRTIEPVWPLPTVPAIVFPAKRFQHDERISPIDDIHPADIFLLPVRMDFQQYMRSIGFD